MSEHIDLSTASLTDISTRIRDRRLSPIALAEHCLDRIEAPNPALNAFITVTTLTSPAPTVEDARARGDAAVSADNTFFCNYYGLPAISVPSGADRHGLPLGVQFVGSRDGDANVLALAHAYQQSTGWRYVPPPRDGLVSGT